jgi:hypothetical protein
MKEFITDKVLLFNTGAITVTMFTELQEVLKIILLIVSITYTIIKMVKGKTGNKSIEEEIQKYFKHKKGDDCEQS